MFKQKHIDIVKNIGFIRCDSNEEIKDIAKHKLAGALQNDVYDYLINEISKGEDNQDEDKNQKYPIHFTTYQSSKGLAADYVFLVGLNDGALPQNPKDILDQEICELIVGLTRTKRQCYLLSIKPSAKVRQWKSSMLNWIPKELVHECCHISVGDVRNVGN